MSNTFLQIVALFLAAFISAIVVSPFATLTYFLMSALVFRILLALLYSVEDERGVLHTLWSELKLESIVCLFLLSLSILFAFESPTIEGIAGRFAAIAFPLFLLVGAVIMCITSYLKYKKIEK